MTGALCASTQSQSVRILWRSGLCIAALAIGIRLVSIDSAVWETCSERNEEEVLTTKWELQGADSEVWEDILKKAHCQNMCYALYRCHDISAGSNWHISLSGVFVNLLTP
jgi:hypothetical protein